LLKIGEDVQNITISEISIEPIPNKAGLVGFCSFIVNASLKVQNVGLHTCISSPYGLRLVFPGTKYKDQINQAVFPINSGTYNYIASEVSMVYRDLMERLR
jgi:hypothetical protein